MEADPAGFRGAPGRGMALGLRDPAPKPQDAADASGPPTGLGLNPSPHLLGLLEKSTEGRIYWPLSWTKSLGLLTSGMA